MEYGDRVTLLSGKTATVDSVEIVVLSEPVNVYNFEVCDYHTYFVGEQNVLVHNACSGKLETNAQATEAAKKLGYTKTNQSAHGNAIFKNSKAVKTLKYISADRDVHSGGIWKAASSIDDLFSKETRSGTYDALLNWIGK